MKYGFVLPGGSATEQVDLAVAADDAGWDAVFVWEGGYAIDPWSLLSAMAMRTARIGLGTMLTPLPWRRPWKLAAQVATLDQLSNGRAMLAVGLGASDPQLGIYPEVTERKARAALLDKHLDIVRGLLSGERSVDGIDLTAAVHPPLLPVQARVPIWCVGAKDRVPSMTRILRCDGLLPTVVGDRSGLPEPDEVREMLDWLTERGWHGDVIVEGETEADTMASITAPWAEAGATWWLEARWSDGDPATVRQRIEAGPVPSTG